MLHYIAQDLTNARYLWKRIPEKFKASGQPSAEPLSQLRSIGKSLAKRDYNQVFNLLGKGYGTEG